MTKVDWYFASQKVNLAESESAVPDIWFSHKRDDCASPKEEITPTIWKRAPILVQWTKWTTWLDSDQGMIKEGCGSGFQEVSLWVFSGLEESWPDSSKTLGTTDPRGSKSSPVYSPLLSWILLFLLKFAISSWCGFQWQNFEWCEKKTTGQWLKPWWLEIFNLTIKGQFLTDEMKWYCPGTALVDLCEPKGGWVGPRMTWCLRALSKRKLSGQSHHLRHLIPISLINSLCSH